MRQLYEDTLPSNIAQQIFVLGSGLAGAAAGMILAKSFSGVSEIPRSTVIGTTIVSIVFTLGAGLYLAKKAEEV